MKATEILEKITDVLQLSASEVNLESMKLENGTVIEAEAFEAGKEVFIATEDERVALPVGEYELESGDVLVVAEEGVISEIKAAEGKPEEEQPAEEQPSEEQPAEMQEEVKAVSREEFESLLSAFNELSEKVAAMMPEDEMSEEPKTEEAKEELSAQEPTPSVKHSPEKVEMKAQGFEYGKKGGNAILDNVLAFLNK